MDFSFGIRVVDDETGNIRPRFVLTKSTYRVWSTIGEHALREEKLWAQIMSTAVRLLPFRVVLLVVPEVVSSPRIATEASVWTSQLRSISLIPS